MGILFILLAAVTLRSDTVLRTGCESDDSAIAEVRGGTAVVVRFALAASGCYKVQAGETTGYVRASDLDGLESFERGRARAAAVVARTRPEVKIMEKSLSVRVDRNGPLAEAMKLLDDNQPSAALASLDPMLKRARPDSSTLIVAGLAAWRSDDSRMALDYWKSALVMNPDPNLKRLYEHVERESKADQGQQKSVGLHVNLRYEDQAVNAGLAREMLEVLDSEYARIAETLGCRHEERITAIVQSRASYVAATGAAEWSGGQFDGKIRIALADSAGVGPKTRRLFAHELVHACLASLGPWPSWFHEGMAQRFSGDRINTQQRELILGMARQHQIPKLEALGSGWSGMTTEQARTAYTVSLYATQRMMEEYEAYGIRNILRNPAKFAEIRHALDRELGSE